MYAYLVDRLDYILILYYYIFVLIENFNGLISFWLFRRKINNNLTMFEGMNYIKSIVVVHWWLFSRKDYLILSAICLITMSKFISHQLDFCSRAAPGRGVAASIDSAAGRWKCCLLNACVSHRANSGNPLLGGGCWCPLPCFPPQAACNQPWNKRHVVRAVNLPATFCPT